MGTTGVLLTGFGGPDTPDDCREFMCSLMGREPSDELVQRVRRRYLAIGGSPLKEIAGEIAVALNGALVEAGAPFPVAVGMRYSNPTIADALASLKTSGCERIVVASLSPFESRVAHGAYREAIDAAATELGGLDIVEAPLVGESEAYASFYAMSTASAITDLEPNEGAVIVFTAHSLPVSDLVENDPYPRGLERVSAAVAEQLGLGDGSHGPKTPIVPFDVFGSAEPPRAWFLAYQSKGARGGEWLGPDLDEVIDAIAASGATSVVFVPVGFLTDHMETLYDIDIDAAGRAVDAGLEYIRAVAPNADKDVIKAMAAAIVAVA